MPRLTGRGSFVVAAWLSGASTRPGLPYAFVADPDEYIIEISGPGPAVFAPPTAR
jgi:hypothetical protein